MTVPLTSLEAPLAIPGKALGLAASTPVLACEGNLYQSRFHQVGKGVDVGLTEKLAPKTAKQEGRLHANRDQT